MFSATAVKMLEIFFLWTVAFSLFLLNFMGFWVQVKYLHEKAHALPGKVLNGAPAPRAHLKYG